MKDNYFTVQQSSRGRYKEKGSKFLSFVYPIQNEEEVHSLLGELKKQYYDAHHHCFAYILGFEEEKYRSFDDGEPSHTAGDPILGQLRSRGITNVLVVVVRYFGGTKLGVGGLIHAYRQAAADALDRTRIVEMFVTKTITIGYPYESTNPIMRLINDYELAIVNQVFEEKCEMSFLVRLNHLNELKEKLVQIKGLTLLAD